MKTQILNSKILLQIAFIFCLILNPALSQADSNKPKEPQASMVISAENKLNINSADAEMISNSLKGIGLKKAVAIVEYREAYGPFKHIEELASVKGIGKKTVQKNSALIAIK